jgi:hypothetical protein
MTFPRCDDVGRQPFAAWLDEERLSRRRNLVLLATAAAWAWVCLPYLGIVFVGIAAPGLPSLAIPKWLLLRHLLADGALALAVGVLSGSALRRLRWAAGPALLATLMGIHVVLALPYLGRTVPVGPSGALGDYFLHLDPLGAAYLGGILVLAALGGLLSPVVLRRVRRRVLINAAWAWTGGSLLSEALVLASMAAHYPGGSYWEWSMTDMIMRCRDNLPYLAGGAWMGWSLQGRPAVGAVVVGAMAAFRAASGLIVFGGQEPWTTALQYTSFIVTRTVVAGAGAWLGALLSGAGSRRELLRPGVAVVCAALVAALIAQFASSRPTEGISAEVEPPVEDGEVILLMKGDALGAVILTKQTMDPERVSYDWCYRTDGNSTFRAQDARHYRSGHVSNATEISFGRFSVSWSGHDNGSGYLYYQHFPGQPVAGDDLRICVTHRRNLEQIDARDPRWLFKGSPSDPGVRLTSVFSVSPVRHGETSAR